MADSLKELFVVLKANTDDFVAKMNDADKKLGTWQKSVDKAGKNLQQLGQKMFLAGTAIVGSLGVMVDSYAKTGEEIEQMKAKTGMGAEALSELKYVLDQVGGTFSNLPASIKAMNLAISSATAGMAPFNKAVADAAATGDKEQLALAQTAAQAAWAKTAFGQLGISLEAHKAMTPEQQFNALTSALQGVTDESTQATLAQAVFGKGSTDLLPLIETILRLYQPNTPPGKRLKHLVREIGQDEFRRRVLDDPAAHEELPTVASLTASVLPVPASEAHRLEARVFAGELGCAGLAALAEIADRHCGGMLMITGEQNVAMHLADGGDPALALDALGKAGFAGEEPSDRVRFRICPGNHECIAGLAATREVARSVIERLGVQGERLSWAISGCPNCCAQPLLAQAGIVASRLVKEPSGRSPRFDLYRPGAGPFAEPVQQGLTLDALLEACAALA